MKRKRYIIGISVLLFVGGAFPSFAAPSVTLPKSEIEHGEFFDIYGSDFGNTPSQYSFVCFGSTSACVRGNDIAARAGFSWSNTLIRMQLPSSGIPISGEIIVVGEGTVTTCAQTVCTSEQGSVDKGRAQYWIKPTISSLLPSSAAKPGDQIRIIGNGFGESAGDVYFDDLPGMVSTWSYRSLEVRIPHSVSKMTKTVRVVSKNGKITSFEFIVSTLLTNDEFSYRQYYLTQIGVPFLWKQTPQKETIVAVLDDGVYQNHPDLQQNMWKNTDELPGNNKDDDNNGYVDDYLGYNFWDNTAAVDPKGGHGTAVAGIIAAVRDNTIGIAGIAQKAKIMSLIVSDGKAVSFDGLKKAVEYAIDNSADIINISAASIGTLGYNDTLTEIFQRAFDKGVVIVVAAGNRDVQGGIGQNLNVIPESPVCNSNGRRILLGVAALNNTDSASNGRIKASWSSYGSNCVNISAPGVAITSTVPPTFQKDKQFYDALDGSSFSAPIVAGVAAAMKSIHPEWKNFDIINRILAGSDDITSFNPGYENQLGGRIQGERLFNESLGTTKIIIPRSSEVRVGEWVRIIIDYYRSDYAIRISDSQSYDAAIPQRAIAVRSADELDVMVPATILPGTYVIRIVPPVGDAVISQEKVTILPARSEEQPQTVPVPKIGTPSSSVQPEQKASSQSAQIPAQEKTRVLSIDKKLVSNLSGFILLQTDAHGEAWYVSPQTGTRYSLGRPADAFAVMRSLGLGVPHSLIAYTKTYSKRFLGRILLDVEKNGEAYYIYPKDKRAYYLGRPADAFVVMQKRGLGISNENLFKIPITY